MIVVDTNVMVYLLTGGPQGAPAARLLADEPEWAAPGVLLSELRNVLVGLVRSGTLQMDDALAVHDDALGVLASRIVRVPGATVMECALDTGLTAYDAEFVTAARLLDVPLYSADREILAKATDVARPLGTTIPGTIGP